MSDAIRQVYLYDGTFEGFLCCVFESYMKKETPVDIVPDTFEQFFIPLRKLKQTADTPIGFSVRLILKCLQR